MAMAPQQCLLRHQQSLSIPPLPSQGSSSKHSSSDNNSRRIENYDGNDELTTAWVPWQVILQATTTARRAQHKTFLESVPTLEQLTEYEILTIADALVEVSYDDGELVCTQGEVGDAFYIIKQVS